MDTVNPTVSAGSCACASPKLVVTVEGIQYAAIPLTLDGLPSCLTCSCSYGGAWQVGRPTAWWNPDFCGLPKKNGQPCRWRLSESPCEHHRTPAQQEEQTLREKRAEQQAREAEERRQAEDTQRRLDLIAILSVSCSHCGAPTASLCRNPRGIPVRPLHAIRRRLAGVPQGPKEFALYGNYYRPDAGEPAMDASLREVLDDPLEDRTKEASDRYGKEQEAAAQARAHTAKRQWWLNVEPRREVILEVDCTQCDAAMGEPCRNGSKELWRLHTERADLAMAKHELTAQVL